ncbi:MAG: hypothetical protein J3K34DRAFT_519584 [Monoraphidium minutum]|nr:MAG: hypothetical protein J3K34DRAFT_519584 [Monoraphidium minutum]
MGRKGMKGFIKSAARRPGEEEEEEEAAPAEEAVAPKAAPKAAAAKPARAAAPAKAAEPAGGGGGGDGSGSDDGGEAGDGPETRGNLLQRHKREMLAHIKALRRSGKKSKDEVTRLTVDIEKRHADELRAFDAGGGGGSGSAAAAAAAGSGKGGAADAAGSAAAAVAAAGAGASAVAAEPLSKFLKGMSVDGGDAASQGRKPTKAQKRREKHAAMDAEREARIAAEKEALGTPERLAEEAELKALLAPLGLGIQEIRADGHCMYRSVEDQLRATARAAKAAKAPVAKAAGVRFADAGSDSDGSDGGGDVPSYQELRELAADHLRSHASEFSPYLVPEDEGEDPAAYYGRYCDALESSAVWGGHVELQALSGALGRRITVYAAGMAAQVLGEGLGSGDDGLTLCFLRHAYGLGEHYNSTKKLLFAPGEAGADAAEEAAAGEGADGGGD